MKKLTVGLLVFCIIIFSISCTSKTLFFTPEMTGFIYSNATKEPLNKLNGEISFNGIDEAQKITLKKDGSFTISSISKSYYFIRPDVKSYSMLPPEIYINFQGYNLKSIDYSEAYSKQVSEKQSGFSNYKKIDLGIIYLDRAKEANE
jgi:hypothetical protein